MNWNIQSVRGRRASEAGSAEWQSVAALLAMALVGFQLFLGVGDASVGIGVVDGGAWIWDSVTSTLGLSNPSNAGALDARVDLGGEGFSSDLTVSGLPGGGYQLVDPATGRVFTLATDGATPQLGLSRKLAASAGLVSRQGARSGYLIDELTGMITTTEVSTGGRPPSPLELDGPIKTVLDRHDVLWALSASSGSLTLILDGKQTQRREFSGLASTASLGVTSEGGVILDAAHKRALVVTGTSAAREISLSRIAAGTSHLSDRDVDGPLAWATIDGTTELWRVPTDGGAPATFALPVGPNDMLGAPEPAPSGIWVPNFTRRELIRVGTDGKVLGGPFPIPAGDDPAAPFELTVGAEGSVYANSPDAEKFLMFDRQGVPHENDKQRSIPAPTPGDLESFGGGDELDDGNASTTTTVPISLPDLTTTSPPPPTDPAPTSQPTPTSDLPPTVPPTTSLDPVSPAPTEPEPTLPAPLLPTSVPPSKAPATTNVELVDPSVTTVSVPGTGQTTTSPLGPGPTTTGPPAPTSPLPVSTLPGTTSPVVTSPATTGTTAPPPTVNPTTTLPPTTLPVATGLPVPTLAPLNTGPGGVDWGHVGVWFDFLEEETEVEVEIAIGGRAVQTVRRTAPRSTTRHVENFGVREAGIAWGGNSQDQIAYRARAANSVGASAWTAWIVSDAVDWQTSCLTPRMPFTSISSPTLNADGETFRYTLSISNSPACPATSWMINGVNSTQSVLTFTAQPEVTTFSYSVVPSNQWGAGPAAAIASVTTPARPGRSVVAMDTTPHGGRTGECWQGWDDNSCTFNLGGGGWIRQEFIATGPFLKSVLAEVCDPGGVRMTLESSPGVPVGGETHGVTAASDMVGGCKTSWNFSGATSLIVGARYTIEFYGMGSNLLAYMNNNDWYAGGGTFRSGGGGDPNPCNGSANSCGDGRDLRLRVNVLDR